MSLDKKKKKKKKNHGGLSNKIKTKSLNLKRNVLISNRGRPMGTAGYTVGIIHPSPPKKKPHLELNNALQNSHPFNINGLVIFVIIILLIVLLLLIVIIIIIILVVINWFGFLGRGPAWAALLTRITLS